MENKSYDPTNSGALFRAKEKRTPTSPDYTGSVNVEGKEFFVSGWKKTSRTGEPFLSLKVTAKTQQRQPSHIPTSNGPDDQPF